MEKLIVSAGVIGSATSMIALYVLIEISIAYWVPGRAGTRWKALVNLPKFLDLAATFRWMMPLLAIYTTVQFLLSLQLISDGLSLG